MVKYEVPAFGAITGNVSQRPHGLFLHVLVVRAQQLDKDGEGSRLDHAPCLQRVTTGNVCEGPGGLELQLVVVALKELDELGHDACVDDFVYGRIRLFGEELAEALCHVELLFFAAVEQELDHVRGDCLLFF